MTGWIDVSNMDAWPHLYCCLAVLLAVVLPRAAGIAGAVQAPTAPTPSTTDGNMSWCRGSVLGGGVLSVSGKGKVSATPDVATVSYTISDTNSSAIAARDQASEVANNVLKALSTVNGIDPHNLTTSGINLRPETSYENGVSNITGYTYSLSYKAKINNATGDAVSEIVDTAVRTGQDAINVDNVQFSVSDGLTAMKLSEARRLAVADAKSTAREYAEELGVQLGPVSSVSDSINSAPPRPYPMAAQFSAAADMSAKAAVSTPVTAEAADIIVNVLMDLRICTAVA